MSNLLLYVCRGNIVGQSPYTPGSPCSTCPLQWSKCYGNSLCCKLYASIYAVMYAVGLLALVAVVGATCNFCMVYIFLTMTCIRFVNLIPSYTSTLFCSEEQYSNQGSRARGGGRHAHNSRSASQCSLCYYLPAWIP